MKNQNGISYLSHDPIERMESLEKSGTVSRLLPVFLLALVTVIMPAAVLAANPPKKYPYPYVSPPAKPFSYSFSLGAGTSVSGSFPKANIRNGEVTGVGAGFSAPLVINASGKIADGTIALVNEDHSLTIPELNVHTPNLSSCFRCEVRW
ncbi:MAG: hypothetical protein IPL59_11330 [Candidatus Competibacteraceae bacterium]|nr:hypothetical protein [Candidatus Competibacteraceae bacterium]MBK8754904.1 hypothetical protein [Candidatus Competibacteraceae bacterium]